MTIMIMTEGWTLQQWSTSPITTTIIIFSVRVHGALRKRRESVTVRVHIP